MDRKASLKLIDLAISDRWIKKLAFFHMLKFHFTNSCIYSYKSRMDELAEKFQVSKKTLYNYIKVLRAKELVFDHGNNLILKSIKKIIFKLGGRRNRCIIRIKDTYSLFDVECVLYAKVLEQKAKQQAFMVSIKRSVKNDQFKSVLDESPFLPSFSYRTVGKFLNVSECKAFKIIKNLNRLGIIETQKQKPKLKTKEIINLKYLEDLPGYRFRGNNGIYEVFGCKHNFINYPVLLKRVGIRQYIKFIKLNYNYL